MVLKLLLKENIDEAKDVMQKRKIQSQLGEVGHEHRLHVGDEDREVQEAMQHMMADPQAMQQMMADPQAMQRTPHVPQRGELQLPSVLAPLDSLGQQSPSGMSW